MDTTPYLPSSTVLFQYLTYNDEAVCIQKSACLISQTTTRISMKFGTEDLQNTYRENLILVRTGKLQPLHYLSANLNSSN
jgi:hypothetical protein